MAYTPKLTYKGKPLVRKDNELYYGSMTDPYVLYLQILTTTPVGEQQVADKVPPDAAFYGYHQGSAGARCVRPPRSACTTLWTSAASGCRRPTRTAESI